jgi:RND family efflux transporter MFP subunit
MMIESHSTRVFIILLALIATLTGCDKLAGKPDKKSADSISQRAERPAHAVEVVRVLRESVRLERTITGTLEVPRTVHIHSEQAGRITELPYYEADKVKQGAALVRLDDNLLHASLAMKVATRKQSELDLKRLQKLAANKLTTEDQLAKASTEVELAKADELFQRTLLSRSVISAPFAGIISARLKEQGDIVGMNEHILTLFDPKLMTAAVQVPEQLHSRMSVTDSVEVRIDSLGDQTFSAKILRIHPVIDAQTRQGTVEIRLDPVPVNARPGQLCRVTLETAATPRRLIPLNALQFDALGSFVYRIDAESKVARTAVTIGLQIGDSIEIIDGVDDGDEIVARGFLGLKSGTTVRIVKPVSAA